MGEQSSVVITADDLAGDSDGRADGDERGEGHGGELGAALCRFAVSGQLRSVDADESNPFGGASDLDDDRVAVDHGRDDGGVGVERWGAAQGCDGERRGERVGPSQSRSMSVPVPSPPPQHIETSP